jgi:hypothetical protein
MTYQQDFSTISRHLNLNFISDLFFVIRKVADPCKMQCEVMPRKPTKHLANTMMIMPALSVFRVQFSQEVPRFTCRTLTIPSIQSSSSFVVE